MDGTIVPLQPRGDRTERDPAASAQRFGELRKMFDDGRLQPEVTTFPLADGPLFRGGWLVRASQRPGQR